MHFNFDWNALQIIWTLTFAALLVLLVVLLGRDRARRYPWFTVSIVLVTLDMLGKRLLSGRMPQLTLAGIFITLADLVVIVGLLVVIEMARQAFRGASRSIWIVNGLGILMVAGLVLLFWGPWPVWKTVHANSQVAVLELMQLAAQKGELLVSVLNIELGLLVVLFGRRFKADWRSHTQKIVIGLSTAATAHLALLGAWQLIAMKAVAHSQAEYDHILGLRDKLTDANGSVYFAVLLWWIVCLWRDEPGTIVGTPAAIAVVDEVVETAEVTPDRPDGPADDPLEGERASDQ
ncbi:MAG: hypothetical protein ABSF16_02335 [Terracidiphilus sp.]|jgi:hypothetical protein